MIANSFIAAGLPFMTMSSIFLTASVMAHSPGNQIEPLLVRKCNDFDLTGDGNAAAWNNTNWNLLTKLDKGGREYESKFKIMYSTTGIYVLFCSEDDRITTQLYENQGNIFNHDVVEVFFHPDPKTPAYFEYEVNQMDNQLILMLSNLNGQRKSWSPWHSEGKNDSGIKMRVNVAGGEKTIGGAIQSWTAEIFFPYTALGLLPNVPPKTGMLWNANFCRLDYDNGGIMKWSWSSTIRTSFHELDHFRSIQFE